MNGLKYLVLVGALLAIPAFAVKKVKPVAMPEEEMMTSEPMMTDSTGCIPECKLVTPMLRAGEVCIKSRESCPPSKFRICKDINIIQDFEIEGGCKQECVKCDEFGACKVVPNGCCCKETCCKPVCKERCCRPRCQRERCCPRRGCCR